MTGVAAPQAVSRRRRIRTIRASRPRGIGAWRFPEWFVVQEAGGSEERERSRRLVHRKALDDKGRFDGRPVVATRFVRACPKGHVDDLDWRRFVHGAEDNCRRQLWLDERGTSGDLADLVVRCECGKSRGLYEATVIELNPLGTCRGARPWLGRNSNEDCKLPSRLLIRTASNAYFPQVVSVLSLPDRGTAVETAVRELWDDLQIVDDAADLAFLKKKPKITEKLAPFARRRGPRGHSRDQGRSGRRAARQAGRARRAARRARGLRRRRARRSELPRAPPAGSGLAPLRALRRDRGGHPASPAARGSGPDRVHALRGGDAGHQRRVRDRRGARADRAGAAVVSGGRESRRGRLPPASRRRGEEVARPAGGRSSGSTASRPGTSAGWRTARPSARSRAARTCCCTRSRTC